MPLECPEGSGQPKVSSFAPLFGGYIELPRRCQILIPSAYEGLC
jgi:hypothetical protein